MPQRIDPYHFDHDVWDLHRNHFRFAREQLEAWEDGSDYWMVPWMPPDPEHLTYGCGHGFAGQGDDAQYQEIIWPIVFVADEDENVEIAETEYEDWWRLFPTLIGWEDDPFTGYYGMDREIPDVVRLWNAWPITAEEANQLDTAVRREFEGGLYSVLRMWWEYVEEWDSLERLEELLTTPVNFDALPPKIRHRRRQELEEAASIHEEWSALASVVDLDQFGNPEQSLKQLMIPLDEDLGRTWSRLQGSRERALRGLRQFPKEIYSREAQTNPWH